ncbi:Holliday junction branch migration protein RuvA [Lutimonas sp.]|jgi:Holliday junction DNA helicase RuvA|uniref:Holliday junction branch migration protein RuvA n=1 Tax=Lutimonas sp. TaxID=1872403 RepID=UPI003C707053
MITHIQGKMVEKNPDHVVVECNGLGYHVNISLQTFSNIPDQENLKLYTHLVIREDAHILFGFYSKTEREIFKMLISVSGVGPSIAITMLSSMDTEEIQQAIGSEDVSKIQSVKGIGLKTAQRVIVDLKDKILKSYEISEDLPSSNNTIKIEALSALEVLGFSRKKIEKVIQVILQNSPDVSLEELIKQALKNL